MPDGHALARVRRVLGIGAWVIVFAGVSSAVYSMALIRMHTTALMISMGASTGLAASAGNSGQVRYAHGMLPVENAARSDRSRLADVVP